VTALVAGPRSSPREVYEIGPLPVPYNEIDRAVFPKLLPMGVRPVVCSDAVFVRRAYLDVIGTLPTAEEARAFIQSRSRTKRIELIDELMERDEFAQYWAMKWGDVLRIKAEFPVNLWPNGAQAYHRWVLSSIAENKPYDEFARELLTSSGSNFRVGPVNFYRAIQVKSPSGIASAVALTLMGTRTDKWPAEKIDGMAVFFSQIGYKPTAEWKEELVFWDPLQASKSPLNVAPGHAAPTTVGQVAPKDQPAAAAPSGKVVAMFPDGKTIELPPNTDPREVFATWLIHPDNPYFTKAIVNRVWAWLVGRGVIHEPDDIRPDNPPINDKLMATLEQEFIKSGYDMRALYRLILTSSTYQFSAMQTFKRPDAAANFASYPIRRLEAEVLIDAVNQITGTSDLYTSPIPEPFTYIPSDMRAIEIADGSITSQFLTLFGRSARATGMFNERAEKPVSSQWLHMLNSGHIQQKLEKSPKLREMFESGKPPVETLQTLYLTILSRFPTEEEAAAAMAYGKFAERAGLLKSDKPGTDKKATQQAMREAWLDVAWALINSQEFLYRH
jgi:hypothetical protein